MTEAFTPTWRVGVFKSAGDHTKHVRKLVEGLEAIAQHEKHDSFCYWIAGQGITVNRAHYDQLVKALAPAWTYVNEHQTQFPELLPGSDITPLIVAMFMERVKASA